MRTRTGAAAGLWFWALAAVAQQCNEVSQVPNNPPTITSGTHCYVNNITLTAAGVTISDGAFVRLVAGNTIQLQNGFRATAGSAATTLHAWVETVPSADYFQPSSGGGAVEVYQPFTWKASSPGGYAHLFEVQALFNTTISGVSACYIKYDQNSEVLNLADNAGIFVGNGLTQGSTETKENSQCKIKGDLWSFSGAGNQLTLNVSVWFKPAWSGTTKNEYLKAFNDYGPNSGWQTMGTWTVQGSTPPAPTVSCSAAPNPAVLGQTVTFTANVVNGSPPFSYLWSDAVSGNQSTASFTPAPGGTYNANIQVTDALSRTATNSCGVVVNAPTIITTSPTGLTVTVDGTPCTSTPCTYYWAAGTQKLISAALAQPSNYFSYWSDNGGQSHTVTALTTPQTFTANYFTNGAVALEQCVEQSGSPVCTLAEGTHTVTSTITVTRSNVTLIGAGSSEVQAKLLRGPTFRDPLILIDAPTFVAPGIKLQNFTVCGGLDRIRDINGHTDEYLAPSPDGADCPRQQTTPLFNSTSCGDMLRRITLAIEQGQQPDVCDEEGETECDFECTDIDVRRVDTGLYHNSNPWPSTSNYALTIASVRLEDSAGHALSLYENAAASPPAHVNDVYMHHSYINGSAITGILYGANNAPDYHTQVCDTNANWLYDQTVFAPRNLRIEDNHFTNNNTGAMGGGAVRWVGLRNNWFTNNYIHPQVGNGAGGTVEFRPCADKIEITGNHFIGPAEVVYNTPALELYARNVDIQGNAEIRDYPLEGIALMGVFGATVAGNSIENNHRNPYPRTGAVAVATSESISGPCGDPRDSRDVVITGNTISDPLYAVYLGEHDLRSSAILRHSPAKTLAVEVAGITGQLGRDSTVVLDSYFPPATTVPEDPGPRALTVRAVGPVTSRCSTSSQPQTFAFPARHTEGAADVRLIEVYFSALAEGVDPQSGPGSGAGGCHFLLYPHPQDNEVWLFDANGGPGFAGWSILGQGGSSLSNGHCTIHAGQTPVPMLEPFIGPYISNVLLVIEFPTSSTSGLKKHIYTAVQDFQERWSDGGIFRYWGWWATQ